MKLGRLLLKGFHSRRKKPARLLSSKSKSATGARSRTKPSIQKSTPSTAVEPSLLGRQPPPVVSPQHGLTINRMLRPDPRLLQSMEGFLLDQRSEHTRRAYGKDLKRFVRFLQLRGLSSNVNASQEGEPDLAETLNRTLIIAYKESLLAEKLEHTTVDRHLATLRSFFKWLVDDGVIEKSPADGVRFLNPKRTSRTVGLTDSEVVRILAEPDVHTRTGAQHYTILALLLYCGVRRSELCSIRCNHIFKERGQTVLRIQGKGNRERLIVLTEQVSHAIDYHLRITRRDPRGDSYLFTPLKNPRDGNLDRPLDPSAIFYLVVRYAKKAGIVSRISPHSCRATAISNARDHEASDRAIQEFAGWASTDMITRYDKRKTTLEGSAARSIDYGARDRIRSK